MVMMMAMVMGQHGTVRLMVMVIVIVCDDGSNGVAG